ncbi:MAG: phosphomannomutase/phosphoglucomutase, partial [Clostridia bacterium]|nr:phosphomannomutase/phosphoglucomutase [Clostridia bacterium]
IDGGEVEAILQLAQEGARISSETEGTVTKTPYMNQYAKTLRDLICNEINADDFARPLRGFHIVVDAGNGAGGFYATHVLAPLGADVSGSQFLEPDGMFPNHIPNPEDKVAMSYISKAVVENGADLGVIFDTDVDRAACVAPDGREINRNALIALAACIALEGNEGGTIVTDSVTSSGLKDFIEKDLGGKHDRFKRGYRNVIDEAKRLNLEECINAPLAIETSGHAAMRDNYFLDDGAYLITRIIIKMAQLKREGQTIADLIAGLVEPVESAEYRIKILDPDFRTTGQKVIDDLTTIMAVTEGYTLADDSAEGVRATKESADGWFLLRLSVHDPILPLNIESNLEGGVREILADLRDFLTSYPALDASCLRESE